MGLFDWFKKSTSPAENTTETTDDPAVTARDTAVGHPDMIVSDTTVADPVVPAVTTDVDAETVPDELSGTWEIDPSHSNIGFTARHAMVTNVRGTFDEIEGRGVLDLANPAASTATVVMKSASINTNSDDRDGHLRSADFFDVENYPEVRFVSTSIERADAKTFRVTGDLTIKSVTRPVTLDFTFTGLARDPFGNLRAGFEGETWVNRKDWGLEWNAALETGGVLVSEKVKLVLDISAIKSS